MKLSAFRTDENKAEDGVVKYFDSEKKCYVRVGRHNNPSFEKEIKRLMEPYRTFRKSKIPQDVIDSCTKKAMAKTILLEMVGFEDDTGEITGTRGTIIADTFENRFKVLDNKNYIEFLDMIATISQDYEAFRVEQEAEDEGNSAISSSGPGPGDEKKSF